MTTLLLVENNPLDKDLFELLCEKKFLIKWAKTLEESKTLLTQFNFDCIILDLGLDDSSGKETVEKVIQFSKNTPIVILTGTNEAELIAETRRFDVVHEYLWKYRDCINLTIQNAIYKAIIKANNLQLPS